MNIPKSIKILGMIYEIEEVEYISREELKLAQIDYMHQKILILSDLGKQKKEQALFHEMLHGIYNALGLDYTDEENTQRIACVLHQVIADNQSIFL
jgi:hypothetical protein